MKKKECPSCAMEVDANLKFCPVCNYEFAEKSNALKWIALLLAIIFLLSIFLL